MKLFFFEFFILFCLFFVKVQCDIIANEYIPEFDAESSFESSEDFFNAIRSNSMSEFKLNNESQPLLPTNVSLSINNRTLKCSINNLIPNNGYLVNFYINDIPFAFYRVRAYDVVWSTMNLNTIFDLYPIKGSQNAYPNFTIDFSADSKFYGDFQCSVQLLGIRNKLDDEIVYNSNRVVIVKEKILTPEQRWNKVFPKVNVSISFNKNNPDDSIYMVKCNVRFDRPVSEYIVYFLSSNKIFGAYFVQSIQKKIRWQLFSKNFLESKNSILVLEEESSYPNFLILMKPNFENLSQFFTCKLEIPSKKHPISFDSNIETLYNVSIATLGVDYNYVTCYVKFEPEIIQHYALYVLDSNNRKIDEKIKSEGGTYKLGSDRNSDVKCAMNVLGKMYYSTN